jgi:hypothetical protein
VSQKRKFQKNRSLGGPSSSVGGNPPLSHHGSTNARPGAAGGNGLKKSGNGKKVLGKQNSNQTNIHNGRMVLNTNLGESSIYEDED